MEKIDNTKQLGSLIRDKRKQQGLTQEALASFCGVGVRFIRELEHGKESCHMGKAMLVLKFLGAQILVEGNDEL